MKVGAMPLFVAVIINMAPPTRAQENDCLSGTMALLNNTEVPTAYQEMLDTIEADLTSINFKKYCTVSPEAVMCTMNVQAFSSTLIQTCRQQGNGIITTINMDLTCSGEVQGRHHDDFPFVVYRVPICLDSLCDTDNLPPELNSMVNTVEQELVSLIEDGIVGNNVMCDVATSGGVGTCSFPCWFLLIFLGMSILLVLGISLL